MQFLKNFLKEEQGQDLVEYTLLLGFIALASAALYQTISENIVTIWTQADTVMGNAASAAGGS